MEGALAGIAPRVFILDKTASTNDDALALARAGAPDGTVVVAREQTAGRGRLNRGWVAEPDGALLASWIARPQMPLDRWTLIPLVAGIACAEAVRARAKIEGALKWPNDLMVGDRKLGGILVEAEVPAFVVVGVGINVSQTKFEPGLQATSIALEGGIRLDRADLLAAIVRSFHQAMTDPSQALDRYRAISCTIGRAVEVELASGSIIGTAHDVDARGGLVVETAAGEVVVTAGDVIHLHTNPLPRASGPC
jgi:BirA family transcriptional regulator, biotin operon repressor / biotin---[acetyl-CoA-carboxylase] ligase